MSLDGRQQAFLKRIRFKPNFGCELTLPLAYWQEEISMDVTKSELETAIPLRIQFLVVSHKEVS